MAPTIFKLTLTTLMVVAVALVTRRWGARVGGLMLGLPIVSGSVSFFLYLDHGAGFARRAAAGTLLGFLAVGAFCATYAVAGRKGPWPAALALSVAAMGLAAWVFEPVQLDWARSGVLALAALSLMARSVGRRSAAVRPPGPRWGIVALQAAVSSGVVLGLTAAASALGPTAAGLIAPLPVITAVNATTSLRRDEARAATALLRSVVVGSWGGAVFFAVLGSMLGAVNPLAAYGAAAVAALAGSTLGARLNAG